MQHSLYSMFRSHRLLGIILLLSMLFCVGCLKEVNRNLTLTEAKRSYESGDYIRAFHLCELQAYQNDDKAQYAIGYMYYYGIGIPQNKELGVAWITASAEKGNRVALTALTKLGAPIPVPVTHVPPPVPPPPPPPPPAVPPPEVLPPNGSAPLPFDGAF